MIYHYEYQGRTYTVRLERSAQGFTAAIGDQTYLLDAQALTNGGWLLAQDGQHHTPVWTAAQGQHRFVQVGDQAFTLERVDNRPNRRKSKTGSGGDLTAQMPGQVIEVLVAEGQTVERGQPLVLLEAMKMEIRIAAPADGVVKRLLVERGAVVERGQALVEFEAKD